MTKPTVYVTRRIPDEGLALLRETCEVRVWEGSLPPARDVLLREVADAAGVLTMLSDRVDAAFFDAAPALKVVGNYAVGYDNIDVPEATRRGIPVGNTPGVLTDTTADLAFALLMAAARRIVEGAAYVQSGAWKTWGPMTLLGQDVHGATLGIVGMGRIGQAMARRGRGFDMRVLYHGGGRDLDFEAEPVTLDDLLRQSDFISLHCPLTPQTRGLIGARELALMKPTAILINTARGAVVDSKALYDALANGTIAYAALDVTDPEPIPMDDPLLGLDNCLIIPHLGSASHATRGKMARMAAENLLAGLRGDRLPTCVNPGVYDGDISIK
ncbi:MAG TPA: D-glycerate dehydrogenase [Aggregatilinea sp.]|uniref:2-hydroxyacid dehydrogenase n=1 Tax=Aggregatilinea sp. TaxID=2806333 RepID=UPI002C09ED9B|nr:D-glycerate dehydrogenase [Aggregatilinea sp.]HML22482.1 D-glycerate dehydrogenase [Aggregatilinea sp.]